MNLNLNIKYKNSEVNLKIKKDASVTISLSIITLGGTILSTPLWMEIANTISTDFIGLSLLDGKSWLYGFVCIAIGLLTFFYGQKKTVNRSLNIKHDILLFNKVEKKLTEENLNVILYNLKTDHSYYNDDDNVFHGLFHFAEQDGNKFINKKLKKKVLSFIDSLKMFDTFAKNEFDIYPRKMMGNYKLCLKPKWNEDRELEIPDYNKSIKYDKLANKLHKLIEQIQNTYKKYRNEIKKQLKI